MTIPKDFKGAELLPPTGDSSYRPEPPKSFEMRCPQCGVPQYCGCESCVKDRNKDKLVWKFTEDGDHISCGACGFTKHGDWWLEECMRLYKESQAQEKKEE